MPKRAKQLFRSPLPARHILADMLLIALSWYLSSILRLGADEIGYHLPVLNRFFPLFLIIRMLIFYFGGVYTTIWRYTSTYDAKKIFTAVGISTLALIAISYFLPEWGWVPRSIFIIDFLLLSFIMMSARMARRLLHEFYQGNLRDSDSSNRVLIYGAGFNGKSLAQRISSDKTLQLKMVGFLDDDPKKQKRKVFGYEVFGGKEKLEEMLEATSANHLIIAIPNPGGEAMREIVGVARRFNIQPQLITDFARGGGPRQKNVQLYRDLELKDLLARESKSIDHSAVAKIVRGRCVLVTGAGGSIGSELCRQLALYEPKKLLLLDHSEFSLYEIDKELRLSQTDLSRVIPLLSDIKDKHVLEGVFRKYSPDIIFHAAAYKHVHLVEANPHASILNNVLGTKNLIDLAVQFNVQDFVMISTDKAVNPAGVMGATKRLCEIMVTAAGKSHRKNYCSVRFGNVLGSSGSLIPLLTRQIKEGGPVTVTHKDMTRYFMLIPEAVSLVLMASTVSKPGDINVLKMGEPIKIIDIARSLIALMGHTEEEIPILFTGLRPGEKMFEELYLSGKELKTEHPDILTLPDGELGLDEIDANWSNIEPKIAHLLSCSQKGQEEALYLLTSYIKPVQAHEGSTHHPLSASAGTSKRVDH